MKLIVGLGNPGKEYSTNRHNIGFLCLNHLAKINRITLDKKQSKARTGTGTIAGEEVLLAKPQTYMNASGQSIALLKLRYPVLSDDIIVIHDDLDLPFGKIRIRFGGSAGGHNGIKSTISSLGTSDFIRLKVGIGRPVADDFAKEDVIVDYVLSDFSYEDKPVLDSTIQRVSEAVICLVSQGLTTAMNKFN
jgi:peptidyl-tRNA hydrolase, PTH1 family